MVVASEALAVAYKAAGGGAKNAPATAAAVEQQKAVITARRAALILHDPLKDKVDRRPAWLAAKYAGAGACVACYSHAPNPKSAFDCRCCARHGPECQDAAYVRFPAGANVQWGKAGKTQTGVVVSYDAEYGRHTVNCGSALVNVYLAFGKDTVVLGAHAAARGGAALRAALLAVAPRWRSSTPQLTAPAKPQQRTQELPQTSNPRRPSTPLRQRRARRSKRLRHLCTLLRRRHLRRRRCRRHRRRRHRLGLCIRFRFR